MQRVQKQGSESENTQRTAQAKFTSWSRENERANAIDDSPAMIAQRKKLNSLFGGAIQRVEEEESLQGKFEAVQRVEEEEPLQGKIIPDFSVQLKEGAVPGYQLPSVQLVASGVSEKFASKHAASKSSNARKKAEEWGGKVTVINTKNVGLDGLANAAVTRGDVFVIEGVKAWEYRDGKQTKSQYSGKAIGNLNDKDQLHHLDGVI